MGVEDWEVKYKMLGKGSLNDFLDEEECDLDIEDSRPNNIIDFTRSNQDSMISQQPLKTKVKTLLNLAYPENYNTIDRRLRKKVRVGLVNTRTDCTGGDLFNADLALLREKRGELVLRQVAEMEEEDEKMMSCLRPYKNGLFYKTRIQAKNKLENTLHDYVVYQDKEETTLRLSTDPNSEGPDEMQGSEEELEKFCSEISQRFKHYKKDSSLDGYSDQLQGYSDRKTTKVKTGRWTPEVMLSPVEEPSDEYVDPIDELQCLVETVSEYLAEKEEEISKYGSLPKLSKTRLSSQGSARTESFGDEQGVAFKELKEDKAIEVKEGNLFERGSGKKNAMNSLFSSLADRIVPSSKQTRSCHFQCLETSDYAVGSSGLSKLLAFMTKSPSLASVALASPTQETPPDKRNFLMPTQQPDAEPQEIQKTLPTSNTQTQHTSEIVKQNVNECELPSSKSSEIRPVNPQKCLSDGGVNRTSKNFSEEDGRNEPCRNHQYSLDQSNDIQVFKHSGAQTRTVIDIQTKTDHCETISQKPTANVGFFCPLKKSFNSLISPVPLMPAQHQTQTVISVFRSENDDREEKSLDISANGNKIEVPVHGSDNVPTQQPPKMVRAMFNLETSWFSSLFNTAPSENPQVQKLMNQSSQPPTGSSHNTVRSEHQKPVSAVNGQMHNIQKTPNTDIPSTAEPNTSQSETQGLFSNLFKSSPPNGTCGIKTGVHSVEGGLFSGIMKFVPTGDLSKGTRSNPTDPGNKSSQITNPAPTHLENRLHTHQQAQNPSPSALSFIPGLELPQPRDHKDCQLSQEPPQPQQASSQRGSMLPGLFKLVSSDSLSNNQDNSWQHQNVLASAHPSHQPSKQNVQGHQSVSNDYTDGQKIIEKCTKRNDGASPPASEHGGFFSSLFTFSSDNLSATQSKSTQHQTRPKNLTQCSLESKSIKQYPTLAQEDTQPGILSGIFNKLTASSEEMAQSKWAPPDQKQQWSVLNKGTSQNAPLYIQQIQLQAVVRDQKSPDLGAQSVQCIDKRTCVNTSSSLISNIFKMCSNKSSSGVDLEMDKETSGSAMFASWPHRRNGTIENNVPVFRGDNNLDLRTLASYERSQQINVAYISNSTSHLPHMSNFPNSSSSNHVKNSTDNLPSFPVVLTGEVHTSQPYLIQSYPSLYSFPEQHDSHNNSFYAHGPSYEHCWNQSMSYDPLEYSHAESSETLLELSQSLSMNVDKNQQYYSTHDWMAFNNSQENSFKQQMFHSGIDNNLNVQMWSSHNRLDMINNCSSCIEEGGALNLSKKGHAKYGNWQSFSKQSFYSLNSVDYLEGYYEEQPTNLSYSANKENTCPRTYRQPASNECYPDLTDCYNGWNYAPATTANIENHAYFEDTEWYQQWLLLLEQGMWWPADDGDCGYFVYTDHEYVYALLTDGSGQYVYACAPEDEVWVNGQMSDNYPNALLHNEMVLVCGFKIPLYNEDELFWFPGQDQNEAQLLNAPLDLSDAYRKGNEIMNLNLERFSQMFESSIPVQRQQAMDFSLYRLNKVKMDTRQQTQKGFANQDSFLEVLDLRVNGTNCSFNNKRTKELLSQKVCISICPTSTTHSSGVYNCYQPRQRRRSPSGLQVKHIDAVSEEEWQKIEEQPKNTVKKVSSLISSLVGKSQESEPCRNITGSKMFTTAINSTNLGMIQEYSDQFSVPEARHEIKGIHSTSLQGIKSKTITYDVSPSVTSKEIANQQTSEIRSSRILPKIPSSVSAQGVTHTSKLARQSTVSQQTSIPEVSTSLADPTKSVSSRDTQGEEKPSEQNKGGFLSFSRNAIGIEEQNQESSTDKGKGMTKLLESVGDMLNIENTNSQLPPKESYSQISSAQHQSFCSRNDAKKTGYVYHGTSKSEAIPKPQRQSRFSLGSQSDIPKTLQTPEEQIPKSASQVFSPNVNDGLNPGGFPTMPPTSCDKSEPFIKPKSGLFGFSIAISRNTNNKEETAGRGILSIFSDSSQQQVPPQRESASQCQVGGETAKTTTSNRILSLFGSSNKEKAAFLSQTTEKTPQKETSMGLLSLFNATSTQQTSTLHTGSSSQASSPKETPGIKVLHVFTGPNPQNLSPTRSTSQQSSHGIPYQDPPNTASQNTGSILDGILGSLSTHNERPVKSLFSRLGGSSPQPTSTTQPVSGPAVNTEIPGKVPPKQLQGIDIIDRAQNPQPAVSNLQEAIPQKETGTSLVSLFGVHSPQQNTPQATPIQSGFLSGSNLNKGVAKGLLSMFIKPSPEQNACLQINAQANISPGASSMEHEQSSKSSVKYTSSVSRVFTTQGDYVDSALTDDKLSIFSTLNQSSSVPLPDETLGTGLLPLLSEVHIQSNEAPYIQTCTSMEAVSAVTMNIASIVDTISVPTELYSNLPTPPICSESEVTSQNATSGLLLFTRSNSQNTAPQAGSILGGFFPGTTGQKDIPSKSTFSMFSGPSSKSRPSASEEPPRKSLFSMFGGTKTQPSTSLLGGIFPGDISLKDVSGRGLLSMFGGPSPTPPPSQTEATSKPHKAEGHFNVSSSFSQSSSKDMLFREEKNLEVQKSQVMRSGHPEVDHKTANTVYVDSINTSGEANETITLQAQSASSKQQNICHSITEAKKETIDGKATADSQGMWESTAFCGDLVGSAHTWPEQNEKQNLPQNETQNQPKQEDMTITEIVTADKEGQQKPPDVEKCVFDISPDVVSGFVSKMFTGAGGPTKTSSVLFSSSQTSFFKSTSTKVSELKQTALFDLPTDSLKSDILGMFKSHEAFKPAEASSLNSNMNLKCTPSAESTEFAVQDQRVPNDIVSSSRVVKLTENLIKTESDLAQHQVIKSDYSITNITPASVNQHEMASLTWLSNDDVIENDIVMVKPIVIVGEPEDILMDKSGPAQQPHISEPSLSIFGMAGLSPPKFSFITESEDARKSFESLFSSAASKRLPTMPQTDGGGLLSGFKSFSTSLFTEKKPVASNNEPTSLFGAKIGLCQTGATIPTETQTPCVLTTQTNLPGYAKSTSSETDLNLLVLKEMKKNISKIDNEIIHERGTVIDLDISEFEDQIKIIGSLDESELQISMFTFEIDCPSQKEQESQLQLPSSTAFSSGLQQECKELLSAKRLVAS